MRPWFTSIKSSFAHSWSKADASRRQKKIAHDKRLFIPLAIRSVRVNHTEIEFRPKTAC
jgi:hypothetical protein